MYEAAAMAAEMIGKPEDVKKYLGFAADLAMSSHNPNALISVADKLFLKGYYERVGSLLDEAALKVPHRSDPLIMSINLAQQTKDPVRMRNAIRELLSLGWPGNDDYFRRESRNQAEKLAKSLREEGRSVEADDLIASLPDFESRDLFIRLTWTGDANYDLLVDEPLGATASVAMPRTVFGGALLNDGRLSHAEEVYVCPRGFDGTYRVRVEEAYSDPKKPTTHLTLEVITHEGTPREHKQTFALDPAQPGRPTEVTLTGGRRKSVLPFVNPLATLALQRVDPLRGPVGGDHHQATNVAQQRADAVGPLRQLVHHTTDPHAVDPALGRRRQRPPHLVPRWRPGRSSTSRS